MNHENEIISMADVAVRTDPGRDPDKQVNEDTAFHVETPHGLLAIVCDGMGGHAGGKEASELAVRTIVELVQGAPDVTKPRDVLRVAIEEANRRVWSMPTAEAGYRPGSTVVAVLVHAGGAEIAHVGDSRIYYVHAGAISQITKDHSMVQEMVDRQLIRPEEAATHPEANKILRALGIAKDVDVELRSEPVPFVAGDVFVLCSDGLSDLVSPSEILEVAGGKPAAQAVYQLVDIANARGGHDNITVMCLRMKGAATPNDAPTIVKTMQLTVEDGSLGSHDPSSKGPHGTVVAMAQAQGASSKGAAGGTQVIAGGTHLAPAIPVAPPPSSGVRPSPSRGASPSGPSPVVGAGIALAIVAIAIVGILVWFSHRRNHVNVPVVEADATAVSSSAPPESEVDAEPPEIPNTPALPSSDVRPGEPPVCRQARRAREKGSPDSILRALDKKCQDTLAATPPTATSN